MSTHVQCKPCVSELLQQKAPSVMQIWWLLTLFYSLSFKGLSDKYIKLFWGNISTSSLRIHLSECLNVNSSFLAVAATCSVDLTAANWKHKGAVNDLPLLIGSSLSFLFIQTTHLFNTVDENLFGKSQVDRAPK